MEDGKIETKPRASQHAATCVLTDGDCALLDFLADRILLCVRAQCDAAPSEAYHHEAGDSEDD